MHLKVLVTLLAVVFIETVSARRRCRPGPPAQSPPTIIVVQGELTPICCAPTPNCCAPTPTFCAPTPNFCAPTPTFCAPTPNCCAPKYASTCYEELVLPAFLTELPSCSKYEKRCEELILPPIRAELPQGLGYFPSAVPLVASCFNPAVEVEGVCCDVNIPVVSSSNYATIATPICPEWASLVRPIIL